MHWSLLHKLPIIKISANEVIPHIALRTIPICCLFIRWIKKILKGYVINYEAVTTAALMYKLKLSLLISIKGP